MEKKYTKSKKSIVTIEEKNDKESFKWTYLTIVAVIFIIFGFIYGFRILNPTTTDWIFASRDLRVDILHHYVGFEAYRFGEWTFPLGLTNAVSYPKNISVIYTDSIPILALFFKSISFLLPKTFQYFGLYGLLCFILQGILSAHIIKRFTNSKSIIIISSIIFSLMPVMIFRMFYHTSLASQWLLLLSLETLFLYSNFNNGKKIYFMWGLISFLASTIHIYYLVMCGIILIGYILLDILNTKKIKKSTLLLIIYLLVAIVSIFIFGGFDSSSFSDDHLGFGKFSYNLNGLINSQGWSTFLNPLPMVWEQYEGFSYLGIGVIILVIIATILIFMWYKNDKKDILKYKNLMISLVVISLISLIVSTSPKVYIGEHLLFDLKFPKFITNIWAIFRSTGRFIWPVVYILTLSSIIVVIKRLKLRTALFILSFCAFLQFIDMGDILFDCYDFYSQEYHFETKHNIYNYEELAKVSNNKKIKFLIFASKDLSGYDLLVYSDWALNHDIKTNRFHFVRTSYDNILKKNVTKFLKEKREDYVYLFSSIDECKSYDLYCYELPSKCSLGYSSEW